MKRLSGLILVLLMTFLCTAALAATEGDWEYTVEDGAATATAYKGSDTSVIVPSTLGGYSLTRLGSGCFMDYTGLTAITIPQTVTSLGAYCFSGCSSLTGITIPDSVTVLEQFCFLECPNLKSVTIPDSVSKIETGCFLDCKSLSKLAVPKSVINIGYTNLNGRYLLAFDRSATTLLVYVNSMAHTYGSDFGFRMEFLDWPSPASTEPEVGTQILDGVDHYEVTKPGEVSYTGGDKNKAKVTIPATIDYNGISLKVTSIAANAFSESKNLTTVTIGKNVKTIGKNAFAGCAKLKTVKGGTAVADIRDAAFMGCVKLASITLEKNVKSIGKNAFNGDKALKTITVKTTKLTTSNVQSGSFKGIYKKAIFKCPKDQLKAYKKLFVKKGAPKTCKFK